MKKIFLISFLAFIVILFPIFSNATVCNGQQVTGPQNLLTRSSPENKIEIMIQVGIYDIDTTNLSAEVDIHLNIVIPENRKQDNLDVWIAGGGDANLVCARIWRTSEATGYSGDYPITHWLIGGNPELYPFESYYIRFPIIPFLAKGELDFGFIFSEDSSASFQGDKTRALMKTFKTKGDGLNEVKVSFENYSITVYGLEGQYLENYPMLRVQIERRESFGFLILSPIFLAYAFLVSSFLIKVPDAPERKKGINGGLRNRLTIYLALFALSIAFFFSVRTIAPYPVVLSLMEIFVINLSICVSLCGIFSIVSNRLLRNLNLAALISCVLATFLVLWSQFLESTIMPVLITLLVPILVFLIPTLYLLFSWLRRGGFKEVGIAFIIFFISVPLILTVSIPSLQNSLPLSANTPWGIITSVWIHGDINHLIANLYHFVGWGTLFLIANMRSGIGARRYSSKVFLRTIFISAFVANAFYLIYGGTSVSRGSSGVGYASMGVLLAYALCNLLMWATTLKSRQGIWHKLRKIKLRKIKRESNKKFDKRFLIYIVRLLSVSIVIAVPLFLIPQIILAPESFFGKVSEGVNVFVHGLGFLLAFLVSFPLFYFYQFSKNVKKKGF